MRVSAIAAALSLFAMIHSAQAQTTCRADQKSAGVAELMFGRKIGERIGVTQGRWARFLEKEVTPLFPDGLTVVDAMGQWRDSVTKRVIREPSKIVTIVLRDQAADQERIDRIVAAYKKQFRQQAVGIIIRPACVSF